MLNLDFVGRMFEEHFLITDVRMQAEFPNERWFWFEPPFHNGQSALLHKQPDDVYRIDLQLGWETDPEEEKKPERVTPRIKAMLGRTTPFKVEWMSVYTFHCRRLERFVHGRVIFIGDSAHVVSPFGARGGNGGIQDVDNLVWKLALVLRGEAKHALLDTYDEERIHGADENILNSSRATTFMTPKTAIERRLRDCVLDLAEDAPFARRLVNSGRLSVPCSLAGMRLQSQDDDLMRGRLIPGSPCADAPVTGSNGRTGWLLERLGRDFTLLHFPGAQLPSGGLPGLGDMRPAPRLVLVTEEPGEAPGAEVVADVQGFVHARYGGARGVTYVIRPDQHVAARFARYDPDAIRRALARACGREAA